MSPVFYSELVLMDIVDRLHLYHWCGNVSSTIRMVLVAGKLHPITGLYRIRMLIYFFRQAAFLYCLVKVFQKADAWHIRVLAVIMMILFTALR